LTTVLEEQAERIQQEAEAPEKLSKGHRVSIQYSVLRTRQQVEQLAQRCHEPDANVEDVVVFFEAIKLQQYVPMLRERDVDGPLLLELVEKGMESLKELVPNNLDATKVRSKLKPRLLDTMPLLEPMRENGRSAYQAVLLTRPFSRTFWKDVV
jgi:hypothetical protein